MPGKLQVNFWDVGQGDCSTIVLPNGKLILIDVGPRGSPVIDWLNDKPKQIHSVVLTHNDSDHVGALPGLIGGFKNRIENFYMLVDRPTRDDVFQKTFRCALEGEQQKHYEIKRLEVGTVIWQDPQLQGELAVLFPTMSGNVLASTPNKTSGIIRLRLGGKTQVIWPGDVTLECLASVCKGENPVVLLGPHHGAPSDYRGATAVGNIAAVQPQNGFISVGTKNKYSHPRPKYLQRLERAGCQIVCSQLTVTCDRNQVRSGVSVMATHLVLGLRPPRRAGIACRGAWQLTWNGTKFESDGLDAEHLARIAKFRRPQCLTGRAYFRDSQVSI